VKDAKKSEIISTIQIFLQRLECRLTKHRYLTSFMCEFIIALI